MRPEHAIQVGLRFPAVFRHSVAARRPGGEQLPRLVEYRLVRSECAHRPEIVGQPHRKRRVCGIFAFARQSAAVQLFPEYPFRVDEQQRGFVFGRFQRRRHADTPFNQGKVHHAKTARQRQRELDEREIFRPLQRWKAKLFLLKEFPSEQLGPRRHRRHQVKTGCECLRSEYARCRQETSIEIGIPFLYIAIFRHDRAGGNQNVEIVHLRLFERLAERGTRGKPVVGVEKADVFAAREVQTGVARDAGALILLFEDSNVVRDIRPAFEPFERTVRRAVVYADDFNAGRRVFREQAR